VRPANVVYGLIVSSFSDAGLRGVEEKLPYLRDLGVTMIWLSPIFEHPPGDFGYGMTDYTRVAPEHGSNDDVTRLVRAAHREGLRVVLDFAPNHTSNQHPMYREVTSTGHGSAYADHYARDIAGTYTHYFSWTDLINLNYDNPAVQKLVVEAMAYWVTEHDIDGYRMDAAWGIRQRTPQFWPECLQLLRATKPDLFLLAEASTLDPYYHRAGFDSAYDWTNHLGTWAWGHAFTDRKGPANDLRYHLGRSTANGDVFRFLNNNDTGPRFITRHGRELTRVATALLLTLPGTPCLYMGDEVGLEFAPYRDRGPVTWSDDPDLFDFHRRLIALRTRHRLDEGPLTLVDNDRRDDCLSYRRPGADGRPVVCVFNFGPDAEVTVAVGSGLTGGAVDVWNGDVVRVDDGDVRVVLARNDFAILALGH
jgi:cyclomaltodextrinase / maltogenic alpha-amylase / neopullulanase